MLQAELKQRGSVLALTVPAAFFAAIDNQSSNGAEAATNGPSDSLRRDFLRMSRGFAVILLAMCALSTFSS